MNQIADRVTLAMATNRIRPVDIPRNGGPSRPSLHRILTDPAYKADGLTLDRLADALRVSRLWLRWGSGPMSTTVMIPTGSGKTSSSLVEMFTHIVPDIAEGFGDRLKMAREEKGLTPTAAARLLKIPKKKIDSLEAGEDHPSMHDLMTISSQLGVPGAWLATGEKSFDDTWVNEASHPYRTNAEIDVELLADILDRVDNAIETLQPEQHRKGRSRIAALVYSRAASNQEIRGDKLNNEIGPLIRLMTDI